MPSSAGARPVVVFDLGGVLIDWNPRYLYRQLIADEAEIERFLAEVCHAEWNEQQDRGRTFAEAVEEAAARHPGERALIEAYHHRWHEMLAGPIEGSVRILEGVEKDRLRAARAHQLVGRKIPDRPRALRVPLLVREHPGLGRGRPDQARPPDFPTAAGRHRPPGEPTASTSTTTPGTSPRPRRSASMRSTSRRPISSARTWPGAEP